VTSADIIAALKQQGIELDKRKIMLAEPIRELGVFQVKIKLHPQVEVMLKVWVVGE
jgi:large subunit ribosomal protein L9